MHWANCWTQLISKNRLVILTINICHVGCRWVNHPHGQVNYQDGVIMWRRVSWEWGKDCHVVLLHIVMNFVYLSEITNCQLFWQFLFSCMHACRKLKRCFPFLVFGASISIYLHDMQQDHEHHQEFITGITQWVLWHSTQLPQCTVKTLGLL